MAIAQQDYFLRAGETVPQYNERIAALRAREVQGTQGGQTAPSLAIVSSGSARTATNQNLQTLAGMEGLFSPISNVQGGQTTGTLPPSNAPASSLAANVPIPQPLDIQSANAALKRIIDQTNAIITGSGVQLSPENRALLNQINGLDANVQSAVAGARDAANQNQYSVLDDYIKQSKELQKQRDTAITNLYQQLSPLRERYIASLAPSALETDLGGQLADVQNKIRERELSLERGTERELAVPRELGISTGRARELERQSQFGTKELQNKEANLLTRLGLTQEARKMQSEGLKAGLSFVLEDAEFAEKAYERQRQQESDVFNRFTALNTIQRQQAADMLESLKGVNPDTLSPDVRAQIAQIAESRGIPSDAIFAGLRSEYDKQTLDALSKRTNIRYQEALIGKTFREGKEAEGVEARLNRAKGADGYIDPTTYGQERIRAEMSPDEFDKRFSYLLNPGDKERLGIKSNQSMDFKNIPS